MSGSKSSGLNAVHICDFSTPLSDMKGAAKRDIIAVYDTILANGGRFSSFDIDGPLAKTVTQIFERGYLLSDRKEGYPYTRCSATEKGIAWREGRLSDCAPCSGRGYLVVKVSKRSGLANRCATCEGRGFHIASTHSAKVKG